MRVHKRATRLAWSGRKKESLRKRREKIEGAEGGRTGVGRHRMEGGRLRRPQKSRTGEQNGQNHGGGVTEVHSTRPDLQGIDISGFHRGGGQVSGCFKKRSLEKACVSD